MTAQKTSVGEFVELATGLQVPEGPIAMPDGSILLVEIRRGTLSRVPAGGGAAEVVAELGGGPNGAAIGPDGACYVVNNGGFLWSDIGGMVIPFDVADMSNQPPDFDGGWVNRVDLATGERSVLYRGHDDGRFCGPNDIVFDTEGGFWFTDFGKMRARDADRGSLFYARRTVELTAYWLYRADGSLRRPYKDDLVSLIHEPTFKALVGPAVFAKMNLIRKRGNDAVHKTFKIAPGDSLPIIR